MKVIGVHLNDVARIAASVNLNVELKDDRGRRRSGMHYVLRPRSEQYAVILELDDDAEVEIACYHGHQAFLQALYDEFPEARVVTIIQDTRSRDEFIATSEKVREEYLRRFGDDPCDCEAAG